ncbi:Nramp family divalent metal transporter [Candidatus Palauibacter sp.]|uniref:Nramp family divalent metal transporter n=1 Tax=Candidatus Palauibacter sp. TaxID=3101350 RepID=UPI003C6EFEE4
MNELGSGPPPPHSIVSSEDEGRRYREGVYEPLDENNLPDAPDGGAFPRRGHGPPFKLVREMSRVPRLKYIIGPSVIALGMGLGSGEFLLWPNLVAANGFSIWWLFWIGVVTQFVVIGEIERWTIATGESTFNGMARLDRFGFWPWLFLVATLVSFFWPGWASQSAEFVGQIVVISGGPDIAWQPMALLMLACIWFGLAVSRIVYNVLERLEIALVAGFFPLLLITLLVVGLVPSNLLELAVGAVSFGRAPAELFTGDQFPTLILAVAYAGTGGTLLLAQSLWLRDKGFGMARFQGRIAGIRGRNEEISTTGFVFDAADPTALGRFRGWMRIVHHELLVSFVFLTLLSVVITCMLVVETLGTDHPGLAGDLTGMVTLQGEAIQRVGGLWLRIAFLLGGSLVIFSTQLAILDTVTRITGCIFYERFGHRTRFFTQKRTFLLFLTIFVLAAMGIITASWIGGEGLDVLQPDFLLLIAGPFTMTSMFLFTLVVGYMNVRRLPAQLGPPAWKRWSLLWAAVLWGWFTAEQLSRTAMSVAAVDPRFMESLALHPIRILFYALWLAALGWFAVRTLPSGEKRRARA